MTRPQVERPRRRRRGLAMVVVAVGALTATLVIMFWMIMVRLHPPDTRAAGEWRFTHVVDSVRWPVQQRILTESREYTIVETSTASTCVVSTTRTPPAALDGDGTSRPVQIGPHRGSYVDDPDAGPEIVWSYADGGTAEVRCSDPTTEDVLLDLAEQVQLTDSRVRLPFMVTSLPAGYHVASIDERRSGSEVAVTLTPDGELAMPSVIISYGGDQPSNRCLPTTANPVCLTVSWSAEELPSAAARARSALDTVEGRLEIVREPADRSTWFDAMTLPAG